MSSQVARLYSAEALVMLGSERRKAMADQITTVSKRRLHRRLGTLAAGDIAAMERAVRLQLGLAA